MKRIITHPEETIYELVASSDCLEFWKSMGFEYNRAGDRDDEYYLRKTCSYGLKQEIGGLAIIQSKGKEGIANRWGCILLPCQFERVEILTSNDSHGIQKLHFVAYKEDCMEMTYTDIDRHIYG